MASNQALHSWYFGSNAIDASSTKPSPFRPFSPTIGAQVKDYTLDGRVDAFFSNFTSYIDRIYTHASSEVYDEKRENDRKGLKYNDNYYDGRLAEKMRGIIYDFAGEYFAFDAKSIEMLKAQKKNVCTNIVKDGRYQELVNKMKMYAVPTLKSTLKSSLPSFLKSGEIESCIKTMDGIVAQELIRIDDVIKAEHARKLEEEKNNKILEANKKIMEEQRIQQNKEYKRQRAKEKMEEKEREKKMEESRRAKAKERHEAKKSVRRNK